MKAPTYGIGLYAPAGFVAEPEAITRAAARLEALGHRVIVDPTASARWQRFSATDDERLAAVMRMASDPRVDLAIAVRGGYGWSRLLDRIDFGAIAASKTRWLGHSDFTAFQLAAWTHAGIVSFSGPMAAYDFGAPEPSSFTNDHCWAPARITRSNWRWRVPPNSPRAGRCGAAISRWSPTWSAHVIFRR